MKPRMLMVLLAAMMALAVIASPVPAAAQVDTRIINIPFNFQLNSTNFAAGKYEITYNGELRLYLLRAADFKNGTYLQTRVVDGQRDPATAGLAFRRYGDAYFLAEIWMGQHAGELPQSVMEREVASKWQKHAQGTIVLALKNK